jgi:hypothetical protein
MLAARLREGARVSIEPSPLLPVVRASADCPGPASCEFTVARVRWYLWCWNLAVRYREPFSNVLRSESRNSRDIDPWIRGGRVDPDRGRAIGLSLELARKDGGLTLATWNAEKISHYLCRAAHTREGTG